jgi:hypothetical protein
VFKGITNREAPRFRGAPLNSVSQFKNSPLEPSSTSLTTFPTTDSVMSFITFLNFPFGTVFSATTGKNRAMVTSRTPLYQWLWRSDKNFLLCGNPQNSSTDDPRSDGNRLCPLAIACISDSFGAVLAVVLILASGADLRNKVRSHTCSASGLATGTGCSSISIVDLLPMQMQSWWSALVDSQSRSLIGISPRSNKTRPRENQSIAAQRGCDRQGILIPIRQTREPTSCGTRRHNAVAA